MPLPPDRDATKALLCDADGNLFDSEIPAFEASARVTNLFLTSMGSGSRYDPEELRRMALGRNFRRLATDLAHEHGAVLPDEELESWVAKEGDAVTLHLAEVLRPDPRVSQALEDLSSRYRLAVVTSSALPRLSACLAVTGLAGLFAEEDRFSAQDSLPRPTSKPDPSVYRWALEKLGVAPEESLAIEDAHVGVASAVGAGIPVVGNLVFVPPTEREARRQALLEAGAADVVEDWAELVGQL